MSNIDIHWLRNKLGPISNVLAILEAEMVEVSDPKANKILQEEIKKSREFIESIRTSQ